MKSYWKEVTYREGTMYDVVRETAKKYPSYLAYDFMGKKVTYNSFIKQIDCAAAALSEIGVKEDEIVCIAMPNVPQALIFLYAVNRIGAVANMIHPLSSPQEMKEFIDRVNAKTLILMDQFYRTFEEVKENTKLEHIIVASAIEVIPRLKKIPYAITQGRKIEKPIWDERTISFSEFMKKGIGNKPNIPVKDHTHLPAVILHSGGTTGKIKGVCHSNYSFNSNVLQMQATGNYLPGDKMLTIMPIFHGNGLAIGVHLVLHFGGCCVLIPRFSPKSYAKDLLKNRCNYTSGVPTLFEKIIEVPEMAKADLSFLKGVFCGADALTVELQNKLNKFFHEHNATVSIRQGYGMTEGVVATTLNPEEIQREGSIGIALPDVDIKIIDPKTDEELPCGEIGEIIFSSVTNMLYYYDDEEETNIILRPRDNGKKYIYSGDLGYIDEEGFVFFKGRIKRMIVTNGYNVFPLELENIIQKHLTVENCCVVGIPDKERIEKVVAFIVLQNGIEATKEIKEDIKEYCRKRIAKYAIPRELVFVDSLPTTKLGKVNYKELIKRYSIIVKN